MEKKKNILKTINMFIILVVPIIYTIMWSVISIAAVAAKYQEANVLLPEEINLLNKSYNMAILIEMGIYTCLQLFAYIAYLCKSKRLQLSSLVLSICAVILTIIDFATHKMVDTEFILLIPIISNLLYLYINKEDKKSKKKKQK